VTVGRDQGGVRGVEWVEWEEWEEWRNGRNGWVGNHGLLKHRCESTKAESVSAVPTCCIAVITRVKRVKYD
jgi:hypothetical protein